jgi:transposase-like protein
MADVKSMSMVAVGRKYGVSDNAVRKWIRWYEYRQEAA